MENVEVSEFYLLTHHLESLIFGKMVSGLGYGFSYDEEPKDRGKHWALLAHDHKNNRFYIAEMERKRIHNFGDKIKPVVKLILFEDLFKRKGRRIYFLGEKKTTVGHLLELVEKNKFNDQVYHPLFNNCQDWVKDLASQLGFGDLFYKDKGAEQYNYVTGEGDYFKLKSKHFRLCDKSKNNLKKACDEKIKLLQSNASQASFFIQNANIIDGSKKFLNQIQISMLGKYKESLKNKNIISDGTDSPSALTYLEKQEVVLNELFEEADLEDIMLTVIEALNDILTRDDTIVNLNNELNEILPEKSECNSESNETEDSIKQNIVENQEETEVDTSIGTEYEELSTYLLQEIVDIIISNK